MPNWCWDSLAVYGSPEDVQAVLTFIAGTNTKFDFDKVIPYPKKYADLDAKVIKFEKELQGAKEEDKAAIRKKYHAPADGYLRNGYNIGGYEWCIKHWGTKWNASSVEIMMDDGPDRAEISFETAWSPPTPIIKKLGKLFPTVAFDLYYEEPGCDFEGDLEIRDGKVVRDDCRPYKGDTYEDEEPVREIKS